MFCHLSWIMLGFFIKKEIEKSHLPWNFKEISGKIYGEKKIRSIIYFQNLRLFDINENWIIVKEQRTDVGHTYKKNPRSGFFLYKKLLLRYGIWDFVEHFFKSGRFGGRVCPPVGAGVNFSKKPPGPFFPKILILRLDFLCFRGIFEKCLQNGNFDFWLFS